MHIIQATRRHEICAGHRVVGQGGHCERLHGHAYVVEFTVQGHEGRTLLDTVGRVLDFGDIRTRLCEWLEANWDHRFLIWESDPLMPGLQELTRESLCVVQFNPTAENMAQYLLTEVGPNQLAGTGVQLVEVTVHETGKCRATATASQW